MATESRISKPSPTKKTSKDASKKRPEKSSATDAAQERGELDQLFGPDAAARPYSEIFPPYASTIYTSTSPTGLESIFGQPEPRHSPDDEQPPSTIAQNGSAHSPQFSAWSPSRYGQTAAQCKAEAAQYSTTYGSNLPTSTSAPYSAVLPRFNPTAPQYSPAHNSDSPESKPISAPRSPASPHFRRAPANYSAAAPRAAGFLYDDDATRFSAREGSPGKNVHFPRRLEKGPTPSDPFLRRSQSPSRSALSRAGDGGDEVARAQVQEEDRVLQGRVVKAAKRGRAEKQSPIKTLRGSTIEMAGLTSLTAPDDSGHFHICARMHDLRSRVHTFATRFPPPPHKGRNVLSSLLNLGNAQLIRYIGCLAMGGDQGVEGWQALLEDKMCRQALVSGIVGRALKEHVFGSLFFGGSEELVESLEEMEREQIEKDGFFRTKKRAALIAKHEQRPTSSLSLDTAIARLTLQLETLLIPFWTLGGSLAPVWDIHTRRELATIVGEAADLSREMRRDNDTIYYWPPTFKDEEFEPARMECLNLRDMISSSPYDRQTADGHEQAVLQAGREGEAEAIVRVVGFPGLVAYRQGGGELAKRELSKENGKHGRAPADVRVQRRRQGQGPLTGKEGFRTRILCKSVVLLQWGRQRLLTKEAGTSVHIKAVKDGAMEKYEEDSSEFVELWDLWKQRGANVERATSRSSWWS